MARLSFLLTTVLFCATQLSAQSTDQNLTFQVSPQQAWIDTGLDLQSGDMVEIWAGAHLPGPIPDRHAIASLPSCEPKGVEASSSADLPLPTAQAGAVIARLHAQGASPILVGDRAELHIEESSHLFLGMNISGSAPCQGAVAVMVRRSADGSAAATAAPNGVQPQGLSSSTDATQAQSNSAASSSDAPAGQKSRGEQLKSQLGTAAQVFMSGQFGIGNKSESSSNAGGSNAVSSENTAGEGSSAASSLKVSDAPLDADLRKGIDGLPRRVNDQFQNQGDMVNFVIVGDQKNVQAALDAATWHVADTSNKSAVVNAIMQTYESKDYLAMPMSTLYLFGRKQDFGYEMAEPIAMVASRHHFRIWKAPFTWQGHEVWVGAGTHDIGFAKDKRNGSVTHKIDPAVDGERDNIGGSLQKANKTKTASYYLPPNPVQDAKNATGDGYHSDGRLLVIILQ